MVGFIVFAISDFAGLAWGPTLVVPGIEGIASGQTVNSNLDFNGNWIFDSWGTNSVGTYQSANGNPGGYLDMTLSGSGPQGYWYQSFRVDGSSPFTGIAQLDVQIVGPLMRGRLIVFVDPSPGAPDLSTAVATITYSGATLWTKTPRLPVDGRMPNPGLYYLKIGFIADAGGGSINVGFDNVRLSWTTDAGVLFYVPLPAPVVFYVTQDKAFFVSYYGFVVAVIALAAGYYAVRDREATVKAFRAPLSAISTRLRIRSTWIAIAQVWMAVTFFQIAFILLVELFGVQATSPIQPTTQTAWLYLYDLANAGVYEEFAFRVLLIGVPMALGSLVLRVMEVNRGGPANGAGTAGRHIVSAWKYLVGGVLRRDSPKETLVAAWAFLVASSAIFGLAHAPGWGSWKVIPAMVAGLGFGYLFLRHGIGAAVLAHFVNDYALSLSLEGVGGYGLEALLTLLFVGLTIAGAGFFTWYAIEAWRALGRLIERFRPPMRFPTRPAPRPPSPYMTAVQPPTP
ncbi:MAG: CPBP family intramembrane metalloprotease, partial [Thermoplasmata archaeon]|nr:CPBP family intramembrane metalloprotease [Thermoplasmata archaeon]